MTNQIVSALRVCVCYTMEGTSERVDTVIQVAAWWKEILNEGMDIYFDTILYAVLDRSETGDCIQAFRNVFSQEIVEK